MILTPPFYLSGEAGKTLGAEGVSLGNLGITDGTLTARSLDADSLVFSIRDNGSRPAIPDDEQWLTLHDDAGQRLFTGIAKRGFEYPARIYRYTVSNVYQGLMETPLLGDDGRPFIIYPAMDLGEILSDIILRAAAAGLRIQAPDDMPEFFPVPKMAFRAATFGVAIEIALKWAPDTVTRMDYSTEIPTLRFRCRGQTEPFTIDLDSDNHKATSIELTPMPEQRALSVSMAYARRDGDDVILYLTQTAGDDAAEARRKVSLYLSGAERTDNFVTEALTTAQKAVTMAQASVDAVGASIDAAAASAQIPLTWAGLYPKDSALVSAVAAQPGFTMAVTGANGSINLYPSISNNVVTAAGIELDNYPITGVVLRTSGGALATGWYPIETGAFTAPELTAAGATKETRFIRGDLYVSCGSGTVPAGQTSVEGAGAAVFTGYTTNYYDSGETAAQFYKRYSIYTIDIEVDAINMAPSAVAAAVKAAAAGGDSALIERAEFVEATPDLAQNYFERQDWLPYKGNIECAPSMPVFPEPGDFINARGDDAPAEWADMAAPVHEVEINLATRAVRAGVGPSPRQDFASLIDRLRIPQEDNYQPG